MRRLLEWLVGLFPAAFQDRFGPDLREQVRVDYDRARARGLLSALGCFIATAADLVGSASAERLRPSVAGPRRTQNPTRWWAMQRWITDLRLAARSLRRSPGYTIVSVATLGLALGANAGIFSVVNTVLLRPLPFSHTDRLVSIKASAPGTDLGDEFNLAPEFYLEYRDQVRAIEAIAVYNWFTATLRSDDRTERVRMSAPTPSLFATLGVAPIMGRLPIATEDGLEMVISHQLWTTWFGTDSAIVGRSYYAMGGTRTVVGVMGPEMDFLDEGVLLWIPFEASREDLVPGRFGGFVDATLARVAPGVSREVLIDQLAAVARTLPERYGGSAEYAEIIERHRPVVRSLQEELTGQVAGPLWLLMGAVGIVLLVACANVANLVIVRVSHRGRDLAIRRAIGAARGDLVRGLLAETVVIAALAGVVAVGLAYLSVPLLLGAAPQEIPHLDEVSITGATLLFTLGASVVAALLCGVLPAIKASAPDLSRIRDAGRGSTGRRHWVRNALVAAQTAMALVLLIGAGLLTRAFLELRDVDPGYDIDDIFTFQIAPEHEGLTDGPSYARFHADFSTRIAALPGVESVGLVENVPLNEGVAVRRFRVEGSGAGEGGPLIGLTFTGGDYFPTMGIALLRGRLFTDADYVSAHNNVLVSESAAELLWPGQDPVGRRLIRESTEDWQTVVGVVEDVKQYDFRDAGQPLVYYPMVGPTPTSWVVSSPAYVVKTARAETMAPEIRALVRQVAPNAPMYRVFTMEGLAADSMLQLSFTMLMLGVASGLALVLGAIGLYGVLSYVVAERTQEIGVRMALGAEAGRVQRMVVGEGARVVVIGLTVGVLAALVSTRVLGSLLFGVGAADAATFVGMSAAMLGVGLVASYLPARRASRVDPVEALRGE